MVRRIGAAACLTALAAMAAAASPGLARDLDNTSERAENSERAEVAPCAQLAADGLTETDRRALARDCALQAERTLGLEDPALVRRYREIADGLAAGRGGSAAQAALPYRRRAHRAAQRLLGAGSPEAGAAALDYARASILSGRCEAQDPATLGVLDAAAAGMRGKGAPSARLQGLREVATAFADLLAYRRAADLLERAARDSGATLGAADWERIGVWRSRIGDMAASAEAYRRGLALESSPRDRVRMEQALKQALFQSGDLEALRALQNKSPQNK